MDILDDMGVSKLSADVFFKSELLLKVDFTVCVCNNLHQIIKNYSF